MSPEASEDHDDRFVVVVNIEGQHALWPAPHPVPPGWDTVHGPADRAACTAYVDRTWTDMRPASLVAHMEGRR